MPITTKKFLGWHSEMNWFWFQSKLHITLLITFLLAGFWVSGVRAQGEGPQCPPGFVFDRLSGVGCVQENCFSVGVLSYTGSCVCLEGYVGCYEPIEFDSALCFPFCPNSSLVACIHPPQVCSSEAGLDSPMGDIDDYGSNSPLSPIVGQMEQFFSGSTTLPPTSTRAAAAAVITTTLLGSWMAMDWLRDKELLTDILDDIKKFGRSLIKPIEKDVKRQVARKVGADLAVDTADILDNWDKRLKADAEKDNNEVKSPPINPEPDQSETDRIADEFLKGGKTVDENLSKKDDIPQAKESAPVTSKVINPKSRVFDGAEAMIILKELGMLPLDEKKNAKIPLTREELDNYIGPAIDNQPRKITLPSGREIIVTKVEAILFEGEEKAVDGYGPKQIDFGKNVVITAELVEEAPTGKTKTGKAPTVTPVGGSQTRNASGAAAPTDQQPAQATDLKPITTQPPGSQPLPQPPSKTGGQNTEGIPGQTALTSDTSGKSDQSTFEREEVAFVNPETGEVIKVDRKTKELLEEAYRLLREKESVDLSEEASRKTGPSGIIDGEEVSSATEDF